MARGLKRVLLILLIFLGPGFVMWYIAHTVENHFIELPYLGYTYTYDENGKVIDSTAYQVGDFHLTTFDGKPITSDSIENKIIIFTTIQNGCNNMHDCGLGLYHFNEIMYDKIINHPDGYSNVKVLSVLTDLNGNPDSIPSDLLKETMSQYNMNNWWLTTGDPSAFISFPFYGDIFRNHPASNKDGEIGTKAFINALVLIDHEGYIRGVSGARKDADIRNFFDLLKVLKKEEFNRERGQEKKK